MDIFLKSFVKQRKNFSNDIPFIASIQQYIAHHFPFENLDVLLQDTQPITEQFLKEKLVNEKRGGLCYELNGLLYLILKKLQLDVTLAVATVWSEPDRNWIIDKTHTIILYENENELFVIDSGSGNNLTLHPLQLEGPTVTSPAGKFRLRRKDTERGSIVAEKSTANGWVLRYAFYPVEVGWEDLTRIKKLIHEHPESPFNKNILIAKTVEDGTLSITNERYRRNWQDGKQKTDTFSSEKELLQSIKSHAPESVYSAVNEFIK